MFVGGHPNAYMQVGSSGLTAANWLTWEPGDYNYYYTNDSPQSTTHNSREHYPYYRDSSGNWTNPSESTTDLRFGHFPVETVGDRTERSEILPATGYRGTNGTVHIQGSYGYFGNYWSSTAYYGNGYCLWFDSSFVSPSSYSNYVDGFAVRCVRP
jgi:hypothetical protein